MNKFKLLLLYVVVASLFLTVGGYYCSFVNFSIVTLTLLTSIYFSESISKWLSRIKKMYLSIIFIVIFCCFNGIFYFLTDSKDFYIVFIVQVFWGILGSGIHIVRRVMLKNGVGFLQNIVQWYLSFFILIFIERFVSSIDGLDVNLEIVEFIIAIFAWEIVNTFLMYREKIKKDKQIASN